MKIDDILVESKLTRTIANKLGRKARANRKDNRERMDREAGKKPNRPDYNADGSVDINPKKKGKFNNDGSIDFDAGDAASKGKYNKDGSIDFKPDDNAKSASTKQKERAADKPKHVNDANDDARTEVDPTGGDKKKGAQRKTQRKLEREYSKYLGTKRAVTKANDAFKAADPAKSDPYKTKRDEALKAHRAQRKIVDGLKAQLG